MGETDMHTGDFITVCVCAVFSLLFPFYRKEKALPCKHPPLRGSTSNFPIGKGDKKNSLNHKDPSNPF